MLPILIYFPQDYFLSIKAEGLSVQCIQVCWVEVHMCLLSYLSYRKCPCCGISSENLSDITNFLLHVGLSTASGSASLTPGLTTIAVEYAWKISLLDPSNHFLCTLYVHALSVLMIVSFFIFYNFPIQMLKHSRKKFIMRNGLSWL